MAGYFVSKDGHYYEGDKADPQDADVTQRPDARHVWNGAAWVAAPPVVPEFVDMRQARLALLGAGLLTTVNNAIAAMPGAGGDAARIEWEFAQNVRRYSPLVQSLAPLVGLTSEQIDALFIQAETL